MLRETQLKKKQETETELKATVTDAEKKFREQAYGG